MTSVPLHLLTALSITAALSAAPLPRRSAAPPPTRSSAWLSRLPDGDTKRKFILDCTGCHQFTEKITRPKGHARTEAEWMEAVSRMLGYAGATTSFPIIAADRDPKATAAWLAKSLPSGEVADVAIPKARAVQVKEYLLPVAQDLPHDLAIESNGDVLITGMFTHRLYRLKPGDGSISEIPIPVADNANPRAIDRDASGAVWMVLGQPMKLAVLADSQWRSFDVGMYPHSLALAPDGKVWFNGHFTRAPELIGWVDPASGKVTTKVVPPHPTLAEGPGGPIPYEIRAARDGRIWLSELQGNRMVSFDPGNGKFQTFPLPRPHSGPRRFDVDSKGIVWIPAYSANQLVRLDPASGKFTEIRLPMADAIPYVVRVDPHDGALWIGTAAADVLLRYDPGANRFDTYDLPTRGALVRHLAIDPRNGAVWLAYGASPGIPARVARVIRR